MSDVIVGIGGTGKETLLSYLHLALLCGNKPVRAYIFDSDMTDSKGTVGKAIADFISSNNSYVLDLERFDIDAKPKKLNTGKTILEEAFRMGVEDEVLLNGFFGHNQRTIDFATGFYGQPMVGSVCMKQTIAELENEPQFKNFLSDATRDAENTVVFVGSNFGGTGAGGSPIIGETVYQYQLHHGGLERLFMAYISHYKWFSLVNVPQNSPIREADLIRNAQSGLHYYGNRLCRIFDKIIMLGLPEDITRDGSNAQQQGDEKDILYPIGALIANAIIQVPFRNRKTAQKDVQPNKFSFEDNKKLSSFRTTVQDANRKSLSLETYWGNRGKTDFRESLEGCLTISYYLAHLCFWLSEYVISPYRSDKVWIENHFPRNFDKIIKHLDRDELRSNLTRLAENLTNSILWFCGFNTPRNKIDFNLTKVPKLTAVWRSMAEVSLSIEPDFEKTFGDSFQGLFMKEFKKPFSYGHANKERLFALELYQRIRAALFDRLR